jgi:integrase
MFLGEFLMRLYLPSRLGLSEGTAYQLRLTVRALERWVGHPVEVEALTETLMRDFLAAYYPGHSPATVNTMRHRLLAVWRQAWQEGLLPAPPRTRLIPRTKERLPLPEAWSPEEVGRILAVVRKLRGMIAGLPKAGWWDSLLRCAYDTGERRGGLLAVRPPEVSLEAQRIIFTRTKTGRPRVCALHPDTVAAIAAIYDPERALIWPWPYSLVNLSGRFRTILRRAKVSFGRDHGGLFHKLRRTCGTLIEMNGGDGSRHLGNSRRVFEQSYLDPRFLPGQLALLPRPKL